MSYTVVGTTRTRAARVLWLLEELGLPYDHIAAGPQSDGAREVNPAGKVPVLIEAGVRITDSTAILTYLADRHGALTHPAGTMARAQQDSVTQFLLDEFDAALWLAARHSFILPEALRNAAIKESLRWEFARSVRVMSARMGEGPFVMGAVMTVPDIILTHCLGWAVGARFAVEDEGLRTYHERMRARPAYLRAMAR
jgi:glutathione S-transferase